MSRIWARCPICKYEGDALKQTGYCASFDSPQVRRVAGVAIPHFVSGHTHTEEEVEVWLEKAPPLPHRPPKEYPCKHCGKMLAEDVERCECGYPGPDHPGYWED